MAGTVVTARVAAPLAPFVSSIGYFEGRFEHAREIALPSGTGQLLVNLDADALHSYPVPGAAGQPAAAQRSGGAALLGPAARPALIDPAEQRRIVWVAFRVGGAYPFVAPDAAATGDQLVDLAALWGSAGADLRGRLLAADGVPGILRTVQGLLIERAVRPLRRDPAVTAAAVALHRGWTVADAADRVGWTPRRLARRFAEQVGLAPKRFARVRRFQRLLRAAAASGGGADWTRLAAECGYHDQAHLIHEFRAHAATTPGGYLPRAADAPNHLPLG